MTEPLTPEEEVKFRDFLRVSRRHYVPDWVAWRLLATLDAARSTSEELRQAVERFIRAYDSLDSWDTVTIEVDGLRAALHSEDEG